MRSFISRNRVSSALAAIALLTAVSGCPSNNDEASDPTIKVGDTPFLPPAYTEQQCLDLASSFPGWATVAPMPEYDAKGRPTLFYAVIPITAGDQLDDLAAVGIDVQPEPIFTKDDNDAGAAGPGVISKSTCGRYEVHWALVPGPTFNAIKTATLQEGETLVDAIIVQPVPEGFADTSITYQGAHPVSYEVLTDAGYLYMGQNAPDPSSADDETVRSAFSLRGALRAVVKKVVRTVAGLTHAIPDLIQRGIGWIDCRIQGCVNLRVNLDIRNTDPNFGGSIGGPSAPDESTMMVRAWGAGTGRDSQMQIPGARIAAVQSLASIHGYSLNMRFEGTTNASSSAGMEIRKGKPTRICMAMENDAATLNDYFTRMEICGLEAGGATRPRTVFQADSTMSLEIQNKYVNVLAQLTDSRAYLRDVAGYTPRQTSVLVGRIANLIGKLSDGRAMTPCLDFPNVVLDGVNGALVSAASLVPVVGQALAVAIAAAEVAIEVDMWLPDVDDTLTGRGVPTHEYGHFAMCSLLHDEDWTAMVQIPSLIIQRIKDGKYQDATDQVAYIMEGWADFFTGQVASGANYFAFEPKDTLRFEGGSVAYCDGTMSDCWDWNYVEDLDATPVWNNSGDQGFLNQVRRIATTLFDAFDGHPGRGNDPGEGDFWGRGKNDRNEDLIVPSEAHNGDGTDEAIRLPGPALRTFIHNWTYAKWQWPAGWRVDEQQFFSALYATIRETRNPETPGRNYTWCDACRMFAQHDGLSCRVTGNVASAGTCEDPNDGNKRTQPSMTLAQMVDVCGSSPSIPGFIGAQPAGTDPSSTCTFTGCPTRAALIGAIGEPGAACMACGAHQVARGSASCAADRCACASTSATTCVECAPDQIVGGADGNTCVSCPAFQVPSADKTACVPCGAHQVAAGGVCVTCPANQLVSPDNTCQSCPAGAMPMSNNLPAGSRASAVGDVCIPVADCTCNGSVCRTVNADGVCVNVIG